MDTFLEITQALRQEVGMGGTGPSSVVGQTGEYKRLCDWVIRSWIEIQELHQEWSFRWGRFNFATDPEQSDPSEYGVCDSGIEAVNPDSLWWYLNSNGVSYKQPLAYLPYENYLQRFGRTYTEPGQPQYLTVLPNFAVKIHPDPDDVYAIGGDFCREAQVLAADADEPYIRSSHRGVILYRAMLLYAEHEEAQSMIATAATEYNQRLNRCRRLFLPQIKWASAPLA